jgi:hypothetical protein
MTSRTSNSPRSPMPKADTTGTAVRGRPLTRLRTIDEAADLLNVSPRGCAIESGARPVHRLGRLVRIGDPDLAAFPAREPLAGSIRAE